MALFLVQHGIAAPSSADAEKELTDRGREQTELIARLAADYGVVIRRIVHSGKKRAAQTAAIYGGIFNADIAEAAGIDPLDDVLPFAAGVDADEDLLVVGHLPFLQRLLSVLVAGTADVKLYHFQNSGLVRLDAEPDEAGNRRWYIKWTLNPTIS